MESGLDHVSLGSAQSGVARGPRERAQLELLGRLSTELIQEDDVGALYEKITEAAVAIMRSQYASLQRLVRRGGPESTAELKLLAFRGFSPRAAEFWAWVRADSACACGMAFRTGKRSVVPDVARCESMKDAPDLETYRETGIRAVQTTPLVSRGGGLLGMISTHWREPHEPTERDLRIFDVLARQAADLIERTEAHEALREKQQRLEAMFDQAAVGIAVIDFNGRLLDANERMCRLADLDRPGLLRRTWADLTHPDDWTDMRGLLEEVATGRRRECVVEQRSRHPGSEWTWVKVTTSALVGDRAEPHRMLAIVEDITRRKRSELLQAQQTRLLERIAGGATASESLVELAAVVARVHPGVRAGVLTRRPERDGPGWAFTHDLEPSFGDGFVGLPTDAAPDAPVAAAIDEGRPALCSDVAEDERFSRSWREHCLAHGVRACSWTPVPGPEGRALASFVMLFDEPREPDDWDQRVAAFGAQVAGTALERERDHERLRRTAELDAFRVRVGDALRSLADSVAIQEAAAGLLGEELGADRVGYAEARPAAGLVEVVRDWASSGTPSAVGSYPLDESIRSLASPHREGSASVIEDASSDPRVSPRAYAATWAAIGARSAIVYPLVDEEDLATALFVHQRSPRRWSEAEVALVSEIGARTRSAVEKAEVEEALRRSHGTFSSLVQNSPMGVYLVDADFRIAAVSRGAQPAFRNVRPLIGHDFATALRVIWPEPFATEAIDRFRHTLATGEAYVAPSLTERRHDVDSVESYEWQIHRVTLPDGRFGVVCYYYDSTELRQTEQALRESEERFRMLADHMAQLAWTCDELGNVTWYNRRWLEYTGLSFEEMKGWNWSKVQHPDHLDRVVARVRHSAETGEPWEDTFPLRGEDGSYRWFLSRAVPIRDEHGRIVRWFGTNTDVTEVRDAQMALSEADRRKDEFLAMLAHELRNPLAPIRNAVEALRVIRASDPVVQSTCEMVERQLAQMVRMVDDLLDVSRITRGKIELRTQRVDVASVAHRAVEAVRPLLEHMEHELTITLPPEPVYLDADSTRLTQAVGNLLNNACKFMDRGGHVALTVERKEHQAVLRVRDEGLGLSADQLTSIFDLFTQVDTSLERVTGGLGIGLTLVKSLVEQHGGTVTAHSRGPGHGSEFVVRLPLSGGLAESATHMATSPRRAPRRRVLIIDDNEDSAASLAILLKLQGHDTWTAPDGLEGVGTAERVRPDVVLLDIGMPNLNGYDVCRRIRAYPWGRDMMLVAVTGHGRDEDRARSQEAGFDHHWVKPLDLGTLTKLLTDVDAG